MGLVGWSEVGWGLGGEGCMGKIVTERFEMGSNEV